MWYIIFFLGGYIKLLSLSYWALIIQVSSPLYMLTSNLLLSYYKPNRLFVLYRNPILLTPSTFANSFTFTSCSLQPFSFSFNLLLLYMLLSYGIKTELSGPFLLEIGGLTLQKIVRCVMTILYSLCICVLSIKIRFQME